MDTNNRDYDSRRMDYMFGNYTCMVHVVRQGDTLYRLSRQYGVKVSAIMMANPFVDIYNLRVGDELCIPRLGRPEDMPVRPMPGMQNNRPMQTMPGIQNNRPMQTMPGMQNNMPADMPEMPARMRTEEFYGESEPVINAELPPMDEKKDV